jgi:hypothetical protein
MSKSHKKFRKHLWVDKRLQLPYLLTFLSFAILTCVGVGILFYIFLKHTHVVFIVSVMKLIPTFPMIAGTFLEIFVELLIREKTLVTATYIIVFSIITCGAFWAGLKLSHRYAGPIVNFKNTVNRIIATRTYHPVNLRKGDELRDIADIFNQTSSSWLKKQAVEHQMLSSCYSIASEALQKADTSKEDQHILRQIQAITHIHRTI